MDNANNLFQFGFVEAQKRNRKLFDGMQHRLALGKNHSTIRCS